MNTNHISVALNYVKSVELLTECFLKRISLLLNFSWMAYKHVTLFSEITHFVYANKYHMTADAARLFSSLLFVVCERGKILYIMYFVHISFNFIAKTTNRCFCWRLWVLSFIRYACLILYGVCTENFVHYDQFLLCSKFLLLCL